MTDPPDATIIPHLLGITSDGVAKTQIVATNLRTGEILIRATDANKLVVFDAAEFTSGYSASDEILFESAGASKGTVTITINSATGGFQQETITTTAALTISLEI